MPIDAGVEADRGAIPGSARTVPVENGWTLYIVECRDGTFYTGITNDIGRRLHQHNRGLASRYTRSRRPVRIVYQAPCMNRSDALMKERAVKALSRGEKECFIEKETGLPRFDR